MPDWTAGILDCGGGMSTPGKDYNVHDRTGKLDVGRLDVLG